MDVNSLDPIQERARAARRRIVLPEAHDRRVVEAAAICARQTICAPILVGDPTAVQRLADDLLVSLDGIEIVDVNASPRLDEYVARFAEARDLPEGAARRLVRRPIVFAAMMVGEGAAGALVAGVSHATEDLVMTAEIAIGYAEESMAPSSFFLMDIPALFGSEGLFLVFADCAVNQEPTAIELADIAITTARSAQRLLGWEPRVAMLSFSTHGSAIHHRVDRVRDAVRLARKRAPDLLIDGELQVDSAIVPMVARQKLGEGPHEVAGKANILIFPDLDAGNIGYKLVQRTAGAAAYGPILQGFAKPVSNLPRGASVDDIVGTMTLVGAG